jgi:RNA polymerase primary sigma factor
MLEHPRACLATHRNMLLCNGTSDISSLSAARNGLVLACLTVFCLVLSCDAFVIPQYRYPTTGRPTAVTELLWRLVPQQCRTATVQTGSALHAMNQRRKNRSISKGRVAKELELELSMLDHDLLSKEEEYELAEILHRARQLQERIDLLISEKKMEARLADGRDDLEEFLGRGDDTTDDYFLEEEVDEDEYSHLSVNYGRSRLREYDAVIAEYGWHPSSIAQKSALLEHHDQQSRNTKAMMFLADTDFPENGSTNNNIAFASTSDDVSLQDAFGLTEDDIVLHLQLPGGRAEMQDVLLEGARARDTLIRSNLKLVSSICKRWSRNSSGGGTGSFYAMYCGGWDRPSLSEAIQEGVIGLTTAVERFNPGRGLRFSTYATYWITNSVRMCFQRASTGCLRLPIHYYEIRTRFKALVKDYYATKGYLPAMAVLAKDLGMTERRLTIILRFTKPLISTDSLQMPMGATNDGGFVLSDALVDDTELKPEDRIELSLLRQSLTQAMAAELAPFERDVLRLRLGLDDGVSRTCREVAKECGGRLSTAEIRSTEKRALKKLRSPVAIATYKLLAYLDFADVDRETVKVR